MYYIKRISVFYVLAMLVALAALFTGCNWFNASAKVEKQLELGVKYLSENKFEEAVLAYQEAIKIDKKSVPAYKGLGVAYSMQDKPDQAEQALQDGLKQVAGSVALKLALAGLMTDQNRKDQAEAIYKEVIAQDASSLQAYQAYARLLAGMNRQNDAVALLEKAASGRPGQYRISALLAEQYIKTGSREKALAALSQSLSAEPNQAAAYKLLEEFYNGRWAELVSLGEQYILQGKPLPGTVIKLTGLYKLGKYGDMVKLYDQLAGDIKASPKVRLLAAQAYLKLGQKDQGLALGSDLKPTDIKDPALLAEIAAFYLDAGDKAAARGLALRGISLDDTVMDNYIILSKSYEEEDKAQSGIWLTKYLLGSAYSVKDAKALTTPGANNSQVVTPVKNEAANVKPVQTQITEDYSKNKDILVNDILAKMGFKIGTPPSEIIKALGQPNGSDWYNGGQYLSYSSKGITYIIGGDYQTLVGAYIGNYELKPGIRPGMSQAEVKRILGKPDYDDYSVEEGGYYLIYHCSGDYHLTFSAADSNSPVDGVEMHYNPDYF
ncbi:tetratricopeptide repeat protein [Pelotomaculum propionicicum]|uniref:tetratricopeptide repeat protein n=1 Tax=Pelotomaculum propionicicum TaxID=258475 RepID=UPI003B7721CC